MKHAGDEALDRLEPLLVALRAIPAIREKKRGIFYRKSQAFLHFHEDPAGLFADVRRADGEFERLPASTLDDHRAIMNFVDECAEALKDAR